MQWPPRRGQTGIGGALDLCCVVRIRQGRDRMRRRRSPQSGPLALGPMGQGRAAKHTPVVAHSFPHGQQLVHSPHTTQAIIPFTHSPRPVPIPSAALPLPPDGLRIAGEIARPPAATTTRHTPSSPSLLPSGWPRLAFPAGWFSRRSLPCPS